MVAHRCLTSTLCIIISYHSGVCVAGVEYRVLVIVDLMNVDLLTDNVSVCMFVSMFVCLWLSVWTLCLHSPFAFVWPFYTYVWPVTTFSPPCAPQSGGGGA